MNQKQVSARYMRREIFEYINRIKGMSVKPGPSWMQFVFDRDFADYRHARTCYNSQWRSTLSTLLEILTPEERRAVFSDPFDIGNMLDIPSKMLTYAALGKNITHSRAYDTSDLKPIKQAVSKLLDTPIKQYFEADPGITLKVLKLLFRYQKGIDKCLCTPRLFSFLSISNSKRPSFEFNDTSAVKDAISKQRIIDELTVHLGSELPPDQRQRVRSTFLSLAKDVMDAETLLKRKVRAQLGINGATPQSAYNKIHESLCSLRKEFPLQRKTQRIDLDLLIYVSRAQVTNRARAVNEVLEAIKDVTLTKTPARSEVLSLSHLLTNENNDHSINLKCISTSNLSNLWQSKKSLFIPILELVFSTKTTDDDYKSYIMVGLQIAYFIPDYRYDCNKITTLDAIALLCIAYTAINNPKAFKYTPYWHGQKNQSERPFFRITGNKYFNSTEIPEGVLVYWGECVKWMKFVLMDQQFYWENDNEITFHINEFLHDVLRSHDLDKIQSFISNLNKIADNNN